LAKPNTHNQDEVSSKHVGGKRAGRVLRAGEGASQCPPKKEKVKFRLDVSRIGMVKNVQSVAQTS